MLRNYSFSRNNVLNEFDERAKLRLKKLQFQILMIWGLNQFTVLLRVDVFSTHLLTHIKLLCFCNTSALLSPRFFLLIFFFLSDQQMVNLFNYITCFFMLRWLWGDAEKLQRRKNLCSTGKRPWRCIESLEMGMKTEKYNKDGQIRLVPHALAAKLSFTKLTSRPHFLTVGGWGSRPSHKYISYSYSQLHYIYILWVFLMQHKWYLW